MGLFDSIGRTFDRVDDVTGAVADTAKLMPFVVGGLALCVGVAIIIYGTSYLPSS
jgi:hypothetical protein